MNTVGSSFGMRRVARSRTAQKPTDASASNAAWLKAFGAGPDDHQHADEAGRDRKPAPPADRLAEHQCRAQRDDQRQRLEDRRRVGERDLRDRRQIGQRAADLAEHAQANRPDQERAETAQRVAIPRQRRDQHHRDHAANQQDLADVELRRHRLGDGVVGREGRPWPQP